MILLMIEVALLFGERWRSVVRGHFSKAFGRFWWCKIYVCMHNGYQLG
jgi:hypothetical protein